MYHYTDGDGFKAISSQINWTFKAKKPPGPHPRGAYFTPLPPDTVDLCTMLMIPKRKTEFLFEFTGDEGLQPIDQGKGRGAYVLYSPIDYVVEKARQRFRDKTANYGSEVKQ